MSHRGPSFVVSLFAAAGSAMAQAPAPASATTAPATVQLSGRLLRGDGTPVAGAAVAFAPLEQWTTDALLGKPPAVTDADGRFALDVPAVVETTAATETLMLVGKGLAAIAPPVRWRYAPAPGTGPRRREATDIGAVVAPEGVRMFGRARDAAGKALAGVTVVARDLLDDNRVLQGPQSTCLCRAQSDASGIFRLDHTLPNAVRLELSAPGCLRRNLAPVAIDAPLDVTMEPGGTIAGRVLDADGRGIDGARVSASYEHSGATSPAAVTAADGSFALPLDYAGRYRLRASKTAPGERALAGTSALLTGPAANLEISIAREAGFQGEVLRVQAVADATGEPIADFRAGAVFQDFANKNASYLEYCLTNSLRASSALATGKAVEIQGPGQGASLTGAIRVTAAGYAPATRRDFEWPAAKEGAAREPLVLRLVAEATIGGKVVDERTGAPVAGAKVWAQIHADATQNWSAGDRDQVPAEAVVTGADGSFALRQLGEGTWDLNVRHPQRPKPLPLAVTLTATEQKTDVAVRMAPGAHVGGRITGLQLPAGSRVFLNPVALPRFAETAYFSSTSMARVPEETQAVAGDGTFAFEGVELASFYLVLLLPSPPRFGTPLALPIEPLRIREGGIQRDFDASADAPARITGKLTFAGAAVPCARLVAVAEEVADNSTVTSWRRYSGPRAPVAADGSFALGVVPGRHRVTILDVATWLALATTAEPISVKTASTATADLQADLTEVAVRFAPEAAGKPMAYVDRLEIRVQSKVAPAGARVIMNNNDNYDQGTGLQIASVGEVVVVPLPAGQVTLLARGGDSQIRVDNQRWNVAPVAREEFELAGAEPRREVTMKIGAPAEIPPADDAPAKEKK